MDEEEKKDENYIPEQPPAPTDGEIAQANAEKVVGDVARFNKMTKDINDSMQYQQFQDQINKQPRAIGEEQVQEAMQRLLKYKAAKANLDGRIVENEQYFKLRHWEGKSDKIKPTAWLWNVILSKHADFMDGYPEPNILAKARDDKQEAKMLSAVVPAVMEANGFYKTFSECSWYKLIKGTSVYGIFWDKTKQMGMGDIAVEKVDVLNLFWEPGITDIQNSREVFYTALVDREKVEAQYPQTKGKLGTGDILNTKKYTYDDTVDVSDKVLVIDWYYKKYNNNKTTLHFCKFVDNIVLYATENDTQMPTAPVINPFTNQPVVDNQGNAAVKPTGLSIAERGWYDHGMYPFVFDPLFRVEGTPCGYSYIDIGRHTQEDIDLLNHSVMNNAMLSSRPRYFVRGDGTINEEEFADFKNDIIHAEGSSVGEDSIRLIDVPALPTNVIEVLNNKIEELKETSGNRDVNNGSSSSGITAASAIAALQESAGKTSRDSLAATYEAYKGVVYQVIELIRQFYNAQRQFRITGDNGQQQYVEYSNQGLQPQNMGSVYGVQLGYRVPQFDIEVNASQASAYSKMSQNELALQLYNAQVFNPQNGDQALALLDIMDFNHKEDIIAHVQQNQNLMKVNQQLIGIALGLAQQYDPQLYQQLAATFGIGQAPAGTSSGGGSAPQASIDDSMKGDTAGETLVNKARAQTQESTQVNQ